MSFCLREAAGVPSEGLKCLYGTPNPKHGGLLILECVCATALAQGAARYEAGIWHEQA
jgi:hypothetical protein